MGHICHMLRQEIIDRGVGCRWTPHGCVSEHLVVYRARWRAAVFTAVNWMVLGNVSGNWDWIICAVKLPGQPQAPWWLSSNWIPCKPLLALFWETVWDRSHSLWAVEHGYLTLQGRHRLLSKVWWEIVLGTCGMLMLLWFGVPRAHSCELGPRFLGPALALLTSGLGHPVEEHVRGKA